MSATASAARADDGVGSGGAAAAALDARFGAGAWRILIREAREETILTSDGREERVKARAWLSWRGNFIGEALGRGETLADAKADAERRLLKSLREGAFAYEEALADNKWPDMLRIRLVETLARALILALMVSVAIHSIVYVFAAAAYVALRYMFGIEADWAAGIIRWPKILTGG